MMYIDDDIDEEEFLFMYDSLTRKNPSFSYWQYSRIEKQLDDMSHAEFKSDFRFQLSELDMLYDALQIPEKFTCANGTIASIQNCFAYIKLLHLD